MKENAIAFGVSSKEFMNILLTYYPNDTNENFDVYIFLDTKRVTENDIREVIGNHNHQVFKNAKYIILNDLYDYYVKKHGYEGKAKYFLYNHGCLFKILMPIYLQEKFGVKRTYVSDDDVFIFKDLSYMFNKYKEFGYKKENLFNLRNKDKYEVLAAFNEIFESNFTMEEINNFSINAGNVIYGYDPKLEYYFKRYMNHPMVHHLFFDFEGYTSWTVEQRFHHFNVHRLMKEKRIVDLIDSKDLRLMQNIDKNAIKNGTQPIYLKTAVPGLIHYPIGAKKPIFLRQFLKGIAWRFGFDYQPKYELTNILYDENWQPPTFKEIQKKIKDPNPKSKSLF